MPHHQQQQQQSITRGFSRLLKQFCNAKKNQQQKNPVNKIIL